MTEKQGHGNPDEQVDTTSTGPTDAGEPDPGPQDGGTGDDPAAKARREAARYRTQLRGAEAERDQAREHLAALRRAEVERALAEHLADPQDLLGGLEDLDRFFTGEGRLDAGAVKREAEAVLAEKPHWRRQPTPDFDGGAREPDQRAQGPSFGEAVKQAAGR
jgi:hypothetical protein